MRQVYTEDEVDTESSNGSTRSTRKYAKINWLKAGFMAADKVLTVSPNYAAEIASNESLGVELDDVIRHDPHPALHCAWRVCCCTVHARLHACLQ